MIEMKKILCIILSLIMLLSFAACRSSGTEEPTEPEEETTDVTGDIDEVTTKPSSNAKASFILPYSEQDSLNPFKAQSQINRVFTTLLYDSLYTLDTEFSPVGVLAQSEEITGDSIIVSLKESARFSDGSSLNASDVVYSFEQAKESGRYKELLSGISSAFATERFKVKFTLESPDAYALNVLTFPIIEYGSAENDVPLGSGRYVYSKKSLSYNKNHISGKKPKIKSIGVCSLSERTDFVSSLQIGNVSFVFRDLADCEVQRAVAQSIPVALNNLVYLGVNSESGALSDKVVRQAINLAIDKDNICSQDFQSYAVRAESPFNPQWKYSREKESIFDQSEAVELLEKNGYKYSSDTDMYRRDKDSKTIRVRILVSSDNEFRKDAAQSISKYLTQIGFDADVVSVKRDKFKEMVKEKSFDIYLGEIKLCENMSLSPFFEKSGKAHYGINLKDSVISSYSEMLSGKKSVAVFENEFSKALPFIPICYRQGIVMTSNTLSDNIKSVSTDVFSNIAEWKMN